MLAFFLEFYLFFYFFYFLFFSLLHSNIQLHVHREGFMASQRSFLPESLSPHPPFKCPSLYFFNVNKCTRGVIN